MEISWNTSHNSKDKTIGRSENSTLPLIEDSVNVQLQNISVSKPSTSQTKEDVTVKVKEIPYLTEDILMSLLSVDDDSTDKYCPLIRIIGEVFSSTESLSRLVWSICNK